MAADIHSEFRRLVSDKMGSIKEPYGSPEFEAKVKVFQDVLIYEFESKVTEALAPLVDEAIEIIKRKGG